MNNFQIIGSGACGFLRIHNLLQNNAKYKGGGPKYQNSFETWDDVNGLIWDSESLSEEERLRRVRQHFGFGSLATSNITHIYIKYIPEILALFPDTKILCLQGEKDHSIKSLTTSWGYRNPCKAKDRTMGLGHNRYAVAQFPNHWRCKTPLNATKKYWETYYRIAYDYSQQYKQNFKLVDAPRFFEDLDYQRDCLQFIGQDIEPKAMPVDFDDETITTSLHGGLGNNLFQMAEVIGFCAKYNLPRPKFGTWDLWMGGGKYPPSYNADRFLGGHNGSHDEFKQTFQSLNWGDNLSATYDTKFMVNDMFTFNKVTNLDDIRDELNVALEPQEGTCSLHLRYCTQPVDDHVNGVVDNAFYSAALKKLPVGTKVWVFSDDNSRAKDQINWFTSRFNQFKFELFVGNAFESLKAMAECEYHILHVSTFSFWSAFLDPRQPNEKTFYPQSFLGTHTDGMIPYKQWQML